MWEERKEGEKVGKVGRRVISSIRTSAVYRMKVLLIFAVEFFCLQTKHVRQMALKRLKLGQNRAL